MKTQNCSQIVTVGGSQGGRLHLKCDGTRAETRFCLSVKRTSPFKSAGVLVQSTTGSRGVRISGSNGTNAGYTMFRGGVKGTGYPLHSPVSPSLPLPCIAMCHHVSTWLYLLCMWVTEKLCSFFLWPDFRHDLRIEMYVCTVNTGFFFFFNCSETFSTQY